MATSSNVINFIHSRTGMSINEISKLPVNKIKFILAALEVKENGQK